MPAFAPLGDRCVRAGFGDRPDEGLGRAILAWCLALDEARIPGVLEWVPSYTAATVFYDPRVIRYAPLCEKLAGIAVGPASLPLRRARKLVLPVRYGGEDGPDLGFVARHAGMTEGEVVERHARGSYSVAMIGFAPGFPYLTGLDPALACPRLDRPRSLVPQGSVGIGGEQTGIYSLSSPGGWRIIGRTPVLLFDPVHRPPSLLSMGDLVRLLPVEEPFREGIYEPVWEER